MKYTFVFSREVTVIAESEEEAFEKVENLVAPTIWASDNCENITVDNIEIELVDKEDEEESEEI